MGREGGAGGRVWREGRVEGHIKPYSHEYRSGATHLQLGERLCGLARSAAIPLPQPRLPLLPQPRLLAQELAVVPSPRVQALSVCTQVLPTGASVLRRVSLVEERAPTVLVFCSGSSHLPRPQHRRRWRTVTVHGD